MFEKIVIIGTGKVAQWLKFVLTASKFNITLVSGRVVQQIPQDADLFIFSLKDTVYEEVLKRIPFKMKFAVHTAGAITQEILKPYSENYGVLYPYQSISNEALNDFCISKLNVPICIEGNNRENTEHLFAFVKQWSEQLFEIEEEQRLSMHVAAVFASNFTNALYSIAYQIFEQNNIAWEIIFPLLQHTLDKAKLGGDPVQWQTGPAVRGDMQTIETHLSYVKREDWQKIYRIITEYIMKYPQV